jgi:hypothetical protein
MKGYSSQFLSWDEIRQIRDDGTFTIQAHGHCHEARFAGPRITGFLDPEFKNDLQAWLFEVDDGHHTAGSPMYEAGSLLSGPRYFDDCTFRNWAISKWGDIERQPLARARLIAALRRVSRMPQFAGHYQSATDWIVEAQQDLRTCQELLASHTGICAEYLAWPFGWWHPEAARLAREAGFSQTFSYNTGKVGDADALSPIVREPAPSSVSELREMLIGRSTSYRTYAKYLQQPKALVSGIYNVLLNVLEVCPSGLLVGALPEGYSCHIRSA